MTLIPFYKTTIESKLTPKEVCQKLALFIDHKNLDEIYLRDFLSYGIMDTLLFSEYDKIFMGEYNEEMIEIRTSSNVGSQGLFNLNYLFAKINSSENGKAIINIKVHAPDFFNGFLIVVGCLMLITILALMYILPSSTPTPLFWMPTFFTVLFYSIILIRFNMGLYVYKERLFPHIKANSIQDILNRRKFNEAKRASRRR